MKVNGKSWIQAHQLLLLEKVLSVAAAVSRSLRGAGNAPVTVLRCIDAVLLYKDREIKETLYVIEGQQTPLLS